MATLVPVALGTALAALALGSGGSLSAATGPGGPLAQRVSAATSAVSSRAVVAVVANARLNIGHPPSAPLNELASVVPDPPASAPYVMRLIQRDFPPVAWHEAVAVAWCESKFRPRDVGYDSNGTHDRGLFQLNDGGTEQYLLEMLGDDPSNLDLALNPVVNVRAAALLYHRDGWSPWTCAQNQT